MARKGAALEMAVLGLLHESPLHGYELRKRLNLLLGWTRLLSYGSLYPALKRMLRDGLVTEVTNPASVSLRQRITYQITPAGRQVFAQADTFDISRDPNPHVAFGSGVHHCLGATLARLEGQEVFKALAERFPSLHLETEHLEYQPSITFRSLKSLPVIWN